MEDFNAIKEQLNTIQQLLEKQTILTKVVLNFKEAVTFLGLSEGHIYQLTSANKIPYYRPNGKKIYFKREELQNWLLRNKQMSVDEAEKETVDFFHNNKITA